MLNWLKAIYHWNNCKLSERQYWFFLTYSQQKKNMTNGPIYSLSLYDSKLNLSVCLCMSMFMSVPLLRFISQHSQYISIAAYGILLRNVYAFYIFFSQIYSNLHFIIRLFNFFLRAQSMKSKGVKHKVKETIIETRAQGPRELSDQVAKIQYV